jgi:hypothetical protein
LKDGVVTVAWAWEWAKSMYQYQDETVCLELLEEQAELVTHSILARSQWWTIAPTDMLDASYAREAEIPILKRHLHRFIAEENMENVGEINATIRYVEQSQQSILNSILWLMSKFQGHIVPPHEKYVNRVGQNPNFKEHPQQTTVWGINI